MRTGNYRHHITIEQKSVTRDSYGAEVVVWTMFVQAWADIRPLSGRELFAAQAVQSEITGEILMHYVPGVVPSMRVAHDGSYYDIHAVIDRGLRHTELKILVSEGLIRQAS